MINLLPLEDQVEITLIGTGGGYGESIVIKLGKESWVIIDSCINPFTKKPLSIEYLNEIGVDTKLVELIICTHWHNDHIKGMAEVLDQCPNAEFCFSAVNDLDKFLRLCGFDESKVSKGAIGSTNEFSKCLEIIEKRNSYFTRAASNLLLFNKKYCGINFEIFALSPSPEIVAKFDTEISQLITNFGKSNTAVINRTPNEKSVALLIKFENHRVVLGADLEVGRSEKEGWRYIIKHSKVLDDFKATLYKVPHHGSENGYLKELFENLISNNSILKISPFAASNLPRSEMLSIYSDHSENLFLTSKNKYSTKPKKRDKSMEKTINRFTKRLAEVKFSHGIIRSRMNYKENNSLWETEVFLDAFKFK